MSQITMRRNEAAVVDQARWPDVAAVPTSGARAVIARALFTRVAAKLAVRVATPGGVTFGGGGIDAPLMRLRRPDHFYRRLGAGGLIGFGESYMAGDWDCDDLTALLTVFASQVATLVPRPLQSVRRFYVRRQPPGDDPSEYNARSNIRRHYDLSNDLFSLFLDETMTYSAALFGEDAAGAPVA
jgi:cyclopropane-fatty-acyl-phospholipid synthase